MTECYKDQKDQEDQVRKEILDGERVFTYEYDNAGNNIRKIDARNKVECWEYDYAGRAVKSIRTDSGQERITSIQYDALGNKRFQWDEAGKKTEFQYDKAGRLIQTIAPFDHRSQIVKYYYEVGTAAASAGAGGAAGAQKAVETVDKTLKFGENDLVYGFYNDASIVQLQQSAGGKFLNSLIRPDGISWIDFSKQMIEKTIAEGNMIRFNLNEWVTYKSFMGIGEYKNAITIQELRYIYQNWDRLNAGIRFYEKGVEVGAPWRNWF